MSIFNLPHDIFPGSTLKAGEVIIHDYSAEKGSFKGKSILHTNAVSLVISGKKTMHFAERTLHIDNSSFHFLSAGNCLASMNLSPHEVFRSILIFFDNAVLTSFYLKYATLIDKVKAKQKRKQESYISFQKDTFIYNYIESLKLLLDNDAEISREIKSLKLEELMLYLLNKDPLTFLSFHQAKSAGLEDLQIKKVIETNITNNINVEELAFLCNMSLSTFKRRFTKVYGTSPNKWIFQRRMEIARDLLLHYHEKPSEIYHKVGYENHSSFTQSFKQTFGMTPKDFQMQQLNVHQ
jgi:AraC-like DNA-binding protein